MFPTIKIPISRKVVAVFITSLIATGLRKVGIYETSAELTALIVGVGAVAAGVIVGEGTKYVNYYLAKKGYPAYVEDQLG